MARISKTQNVRKRCSCTKWKECSHPWYIRHKDKTRGALRGRLVDLVGREPLDFSDATAEARRAIVAWTDGRDARALVPGDAPTVTQLLEAYAERPHGSTPDPYQQGLILRTKVHGRPFGDWRGTEVTHKMLEAFRQQRSTVAGNRDLALLRAMFNWAVVDGLIPTTPFKVGTEPIVKLAREEARTRRLHPGEDVRLLKVAGRLHDLIVAALETGCRKGELLSLQWAQVGHDLFLPAGKTKAKKPRRVPISQLLWSVLKARRCDPAGEVLPPDGYVFGDEIGRRRCSIKTAWRLTCARAGITGLTFHDLRREAGSRWMDAGVPLKRISTWLGHANIAQTSTYLAASDGDDPAAMARFEAARRGGPYWALFSTSKGRKRPPSAGAILKKASKTAKGAGAAWPVH